MRQIFFIFHVLRQPQTRESKIGSPMTPGPKRLSTAFKLAGIANLIMSNFIQCFGGFALILGSLIPPVVVNWLDQTWTPLTTPVDPLSPGSDLEKIVTLVPSASPRNSGFPALCETGFSVQVSPGPFAWMSTPAGAISLIFIETSSCSRLLSSFRGSALVAILHYYYSFYHRSLWCQRSSCLAFVRSRAMVYAPAACRTVYRIP